MSLAREFTETIEDLAPDWSDLYFELQLYDEALFDQVRLWLAPLQLRRMAGHRDRFSFRVSRERGYGAPVPLAESCLAKVDEDSIRGTLTLERVLHDVKPNLTQGPVIGPGAS